MAKKIVKISVEDFEAMKNEISETRQKNKKLLEIIKRYNIDISHIEE